MKIAEVLLRGGHQGSVEVLCIQDGTFPILGEMKASLIMDQHV